MYVNKCVKCGREFETKNPKRVICPDCLYPDKKMMINPSLDSGDAAEKQPAAQAETQQQPLNGYSTENQPQFYNKYNTGESRPMRSYNSNQAGGYNNQRSQSGYNNRNNNYNNNRGGYNNNRQQGSGYRRDNNYNRQGGYNNQRSQGGYNNRNNNYNNRRPQQGGFNRGGFNNRRPQRSKAPKQLLVSREQLEQIELLYKVMLPLPNPDAHEVIGEKIGLEPRKVFFGINLVRQKMMLPKLPFPKRKLAISPDQLFAIKNLYEPLLPLPPIGCHKIIAAQLKMDEWRVHVGIGLIRSQMGLQRWNQEREDCPEEFKKPKEEVAVTADVAAPVAEPGVEVQKPKRVRKPKKAEESENE